MKSASATTTIDGPDGVSRFAEASSPPATAATPIAAAPAAILSGLEAKRRTVAAGIISKATISPSTARAAAPPTQIAARQGRDRRIAESREPDGVERRVDVAGGETAGERHQTAQGQGQGQGRADRQPLRHVAHADRRRAFHDSLVDLDQPEDGLGAGRFAGAVGADQIDQLAPAHRQLDMPENPAFAALHADAAGGDERSGVPGRRSRHGHRFPPIGRAAWQMGRRPMRIASTRLNGRGCHHKTPRAMYPTGRSRARD